jgi:hypothetical protein
MNSAVLRRSLLILSLSVFPLAAGCDHSAANKALSAAKPSAEDRYNNIMDSFRRKVDDQPVGFTVTDTTGRSTMVGSSKVTSELIPPATPDGHYRAIITVTTESHYSLRRPPKSAEDTEREQNAKNQNSTALNDKDRQGVGILEPDLTAHRSDSSSSIPEPQMEEDKVTRRPTEDVRKYELVDDGQRWVLVTKLDPKTEAAIQFAFDDALARQ